MKWRTFVTLASLWTTFMTFLAAFSLSFRASYTLGLVVWAIGVWGWCLTMVVELCLFHI